MINFTRHMLLVAFATWMIVSGGCSSLSLNGGNSQANVQKPIDPQQVQNTLMSFASRYLNATSDVYDRVQSDSTTDEARNAAQKYKLLAGFGAIDNAVDPNPIVGLMDMALMVTLTRETMEDTWAIQTFGVKNAAMIIAALKLQENTVWTLAGDYLTPEQIEELHDLAQRWRQEHPTQRYIGGAQLVDFSESNNADKTNTNEPRLSISIFNFLDLDPFTGLDPAVRQVEESRVLAQRMFFYLQHMPMLLSWQVDALYSQMLTQPQIVQLLKETATVSANSTDFTHATARFSDASADFAQSIEAFREQLPQQQALLIRQLGDIVTVQRIAALQRADADTAALLNTTIRQLNDLIATQRNAAVQQLGATVSAQQDAMTRNLQGVLNSAIDRLYQRAFLLVLIAAGSLLAVLLIHRTVTRMFFDEKDRR